jgi:hypothetical protein
MLVMILLTADAGHDPAVLTADAGHDPPDG